MDGEEMLHQQLKPHPYPGCGFCFEAVACTQPTTIAGLPQRALRARPVVSNVVSCHLTDTNGSEPSEGAE